MATYRPKENQLPQNAVKTVDNHQGFSQGLANSRNTSQKVNVASHSLSTKTAENNLYLMSLAGGLISFDFRHGLELFLFIPLSAIWR
ncbi:MULTISPECIES: hypothetical protein [Pirellulaceae]|uniref:hypothetical protein n=1 Tax=Pirellulaceae TaxID=2691357 RepID=UPI0011AFFDB2|nr:MULTISPECIES: hypothetical protein [Pirellulaceae]